MGVQLEMSLRAYESIKPMKVTIRQRIVEYLQANGPNTCDGIERALGLRHQTCSARIRELHLDGEIRDTGVQGVTDSGRKATMWQVDKSFVFFRD